MRPRSRRRASRGRFAAADSRSGGPPDLAPLATRLVARSVGAAPRGSLTDELGEQLADWGKVVRLVTRGRATGRPLEVALGYVEEPDGSLLIAAGTPESDWARNLEADPRCRVTHAHRSWDALAESLDGPDSNRAVRELVLRYGTPAERLGRGPAFRLRAAAAQADPAARGESAKEP
jgi:deazaflavin-dependent oxidoreductase (nitroreductase family)